MGKLMGFRQWLADQIRLNSEHCRFAAMALRDPQLFATPLFQCRGRARRAGKLRSRIRSVRKRLECYTREGHGPSDDARDREMRAMLEPLLAKVKAERHGCVCSAVARRLSPLRADPGCRSREVGQALLE